MFVVQLFRVLVNYNMSIGKGCEQGRKILSKSNKGRVKYKLQGG
jgi:hypothetical protein